MRRAHGHRKRGGAVALAPRAKGRAANSEEVDVVGIGANVREQARGIRVCKCIRHGKPTPVSAGESASTSDG